MANLIQNYRKVYNAHTRLEEVYAELSADLKGVPDSEVILNSLSKTMEEANLLAVRYNEAVNDNC